MWQTDTKTRMCLPLRRNSWLLILCSLRFTFPCNLWKLLENTLLVKAGRRLHFYWFYHLPLLTAHKRDHLRSHSHFYKRHLCWRLLGGKNIVCWELNTGVDPDLAQRQKHQLTTSNYGHNHYYYCVIEYIQSSLFQLTTSVFIVIIVWSKVVFVCFSRSTRVLWPTPYGTWPPTLVKPQTQTHS